MPAMNDAIAKLRTLTNTTLTPMPAAERSLARTASIAEPNELRPQQGDAERDDDADDQAHEPELTGVGTSFPAPTPRSDAEHLRLPDGVAEETRSRSVLRNQIASRPNAERERDDAEGQAPQSQGGEPDHDTDDRRRGRGEERRDRERHAPVDREVAQHERPRAGEGELRERHLPGVARDHDEREGQDREDERGDHRGARRAAGDEQRDRPDDEARRRSA